MAGRTGVSCWAAAPHCHSASSASVAIRRSMSVPARSPSVRRKAFSAILADVTLSSRFDFTDEILTGASVSGTSFFTAKFSDGHTQDFALTNSQGVLNADASVSSNGHGGTYHHLQQHLAFVVCDQRSPLPLRLGAAHHPLLRPRRGQSALGRGPGRPSSRCSMLFRPRMARRGNAPCLPCSIWGRCIPAVCDCCTSGDSARTRSSRPRVLLDRFVRHHAPRFLGPVRTVRPAAPPRRAVPGLGAGAFRAAADAVEPGLA